MMPWLFTVNNPILMTGATLKAWRHRLGLTQRQAAEMLGVSAITLSAWEIGRVTIKRPRMLLLALRALEAELAK
jgi:transcriptional regulator with XRE-family HTH domain